MFFLSGWQPCSSDVTITPAIKVIVSLELGRNVREKMNKDAAKGGEGVPPAPQSFLFQPSHLFLCFRSIYSTIFNRDNNTSSSGNATSLPHNHASHSGLRHCCLLCKWGSLCPFFMSPLFSYLCWYLSVLLKASSPHPSSCFLWSLLACLQIELFYTW